MKPPNLDYDVSAPPPKISWNFSSFFGAFQETPLYSKSHLSFISALVLLMAEILHHLGWCWNPINNGKNYQPQLVIGGFQPSTVSAFLRASLAMPQSGMQSAIASSTHFAIGSGLPWENSCASVVDQLPIFPYNRWRDGIQPNSRGLYTHYKDSLLKVGWSVIVWKSGPKIRKVVPFVCRLKIDV